MQVRAIKSIKTISSFRCDLSCKRSKKYRDMSDISAFIQHGDGLSQYRVSNIDINTGPYKEYLTLTERKNAVPGIGYMLRM